MKNITSSELYLLWECKVISIQIFAVFFSAFFSFFFLNKINNFLIRKFSYDGQKYITPRSSSHKQHTSLIAYRQRFIECPSEW